MTIASEITRLQSVKSKDAEKMVTMLCRNVRSLAIVERY